MLPALNPRWILGSLDLTESPFAMRWGADHGSAELVLRALAEVLQDGEAVSLDRTKNRSVTLPVLIEDVDMARLADAEAALALECAKERNTLTFIPGDGFGAPTVFDVFVSQPVYTRDDDAEQMGFRRFDVTLPALPSVRPQTPITVTVDPPPASVTVTPVDTCQSTVGWTSRGGTSPVVLSGGIYTESKQGPLASGTTALTLVRSGLAVPIPSGDTYLRIEAQAAVMGADFDRMVVGIEIDAGAIHYTTIAAQQGSTYWHRLSSDYGTAITGIEVQLGAQGNGGSPSLFLTVFDLSLTDATVDPDGTNKALWRTLPVAGTARTQASISLARTDDTQGLGNCLVYTSPVRPGMSQPSLRDVQSFASNETIDTANTVSGKYTAFGAPTDSLKGRFPITGLAPGATYQIIARAHVTTAGPLTIGGEVTTKIGETTIGAAVPWQVLHNFDVALVWQLIQLGRVRMPPVAAGPDAEVEFAIGAATRLRVDDVWLCDITNGRLTVVNAGKGAVAAGSVASRLWIDSASLANPYPSIMLGTKEDRSDQWYPGTAIQSYGVHDVRPTSLNVYTVTDEAADTILGLTHYPRFPNHVGSVSS